jgi:ABC-2 type transport system ATP-binding protein
VRFETPEELAKAASVLTTAGVEVQPQPDHLMLPRVTRPAWISRTLAEAGIYVAQLMPVTIDLESVFLQLTGTAPVPGHHRQVDQSVKVEPTTGPTAAPTAPTAGTGVKS